MAELSPGTQAIIDRLKAEGDLVRNSGTNSVRSVKFQLDKFESIFNVISNNISEQTDMMRLQLGMQSEAVEKANTREQFEELAPPPPATPERDDGVTPLKDVGNKTGDAIAKALSMKNLALGAAGLFVGFNLLKGYIDEETDGGFSKMQASIGAISWDDVTTGFTGMTTAMSAINWTNFSGAINSMADTVNTFTTWIGDVGVGDIVSTVVAGGLVSAGAKGAMMGLLGKAGGAGMAGRLAAIGPGIALAAAGLAVYYGDDIANWIGGQMGIENPETIRDMGTMVKFGGVALSIGAMFGPPGLLVAAAATAAVGLGLLIHGWIKKTKISEAEKFNAEVDAALAIANAEPDPTNLSDGTLEDLFRARQEAFRRTMLWLSDDERRKAQAALEETEKFIGLQETDASVGINQLQMNSLRERILGGDQDAIAELQSYVMGRAIETEGSIIRWRPFGENVSNDDFARGLIEDFGSNAFGDKGLTPLQQAEQFKAWESIADAINGDIKINEGPKAIPQSYKQGANGTITDDDGRLILYDAFGNPRILTNQEQNGDMGRLLRGELGLSMGAGGNVIIGGATTIAPSPTYITNGGHQVSQVSFSGGGGMGAKTLLPYGITSGLIA
jgi:hypothetical protein